MGSSIFDAAAEDEEATLESLGDKTKGMSKVYIKPLSHKVKIGNIKYSNLLDELKRNKNTLGTDDDFVPF